MLINGGAGSGEINALINLISHQPDIDKIYFYAKDSFEAKYQQFINKRKLIDLQHLEDPKAVMEYLN